MKTSKTILAILFVAIALMAASENKVGIYQGILAEPQVLIKEADPEVKERISGRIIYTYSSSYKQYFFSDKMEKGLTYEMEEMNSRAFFLTIEAPWRITDNGWDQLPSAKMNTSHGTVTPRKQSGKSVKRLKPLRPKRKIIIPKAPQPVNNQD